MTVNGIFYRWVAPLALLAAVAAFVAQAVAR